MRWRTCEERADLDTQQQLADAAETLGDLLAEAGDLWEQTPADLWLRIAEAASRVATAAAQLARDDTDRTLN